MAHTASITEGNDSALDELCQQLHREGQLLGDQDDWPETQLNLCGQYDVFRWFMPRSWHGFEWTDADVMRGYLRLSAACLTTTFVITQRTAACRRILASNNESMKARLLGDLASGDSFATVGISHLTTSRRHLQRPVMRATETHNGFLLDGMTPWVTGAPFADHLVVGATLPDDRQILMVVDPEREGVEVAPSQSLVALSASRTGPVHFHQLEVSREHLLAGPVENVMAQGIGARTGGLQTSALALGLSRAAIDYINGESQRRPDLAENSHALDSQWNAAVSDLLTIAAGDPVCSNDELRFRANSLVLRSTQSALAAAKGAGFVNGHPVGRWCREALFFLVWSCPQGVVAANLCELASIDD